MEFLKREMWNKLAGWKDRSIVRSSSAACARLANPKKYGTHPAIRLADTNVGGGDGFLTLPLYALGFLNEQGEALTVEPVSIHMP